jgi:hypothetical protein
MPSAFVNFTRDGEVLAPLDPLKVLERDLRLFGEFFLNRVRRLLCVNLEDSAHREGRPNPPCLKPPKSWPEPLVGRCELR